MLAEPTLPENDMVNATKKNPEESIVVSHHFPGTQVFNGKKGAVHTWFNKKGKSVPIYRPASCMEFICHSSAVGAHWMFLFCLAHICGIAWTIIFIQHRCRQNCTHHYRSSIKRVRFCQNACYLHPYTPLARPC